jgi:hypothetical protein
MKQPSKSSICHCSGSSSRFIDCGGCRSLLPSESSEALSATCISPEQQQPPEEVPTAAPSPRFHSIEISLAFGPS